MNTFEKVYEIVKCIPKGNVATYGDIALQMGNIKLSRAVGYALHSNPDPKNIPCYRIVNRFGKVSQAFAFGGQNAQIQLLRLDGIEVSDDGYVDLKKYRYNFGDTIK